MSTLDSELHIYNNSNCIKTDNHEFNSMFNDNVFTAKCLGLIHVNIRSINKNFDEFNAYMQTLHYQFSVIVLTETWLAGGKLDAYQLPGYRTFATPSIGRSGGIRVYVNNTITAQEISFQHGDSFQSLNLKLSIPKQKPVTICCIYRSPSSSKLSFNNDFTATYENVFCPNEQICFIGDFNFNLLSNNDPQTDQYINFMHSLSLLPLITLPTRCVADKDSDTTNYSLLDHIWTNILSPSKSFVFEIAITDHFPIGTVFQTITGDTLFEVTFRDFSQERIDKLLSEADLIAFAYNPEDDLHLLHCQFYDWLTATLNEYFPICKKTIGAKCLNSPWLTKPIIRCINKKHRLFKLLKDGAIDRSYFNNYRNKLTYLIKFSKSLHYNRLFNRAKNNIKDTWNIINKTLNRTKTTQIKNLCINNKIVSDDSMICDAFNSYFVNIVKNIEGASTGGHDVVTNDMLNNIPTVRNSAVFLDTDALEVQRAFSQLKNSNNLRMPTKFLKLISPLISTTVSGLFNKCLAEGVYPDILKSAIVTPIFKTGSPTDPNNYRSISVLPDLNKVYEELLLMRLNNFLQSHNILSRSQYGFRKDRCTQEACIGLLSTLNNAYTHKSYAVCLFIDFKKAFDTVNHTILLKKMERYGIRGQILQLFKSYLSNRIQRVVVNNAISDPLPISSGVPQGSKLGPILFNIYVNDISQLPFMNTCTFQFADDTAFSSNSNDLDNLIETFNSNMQIFNAWCNANKLHLNLNKTKAMLFTPRYLTGPPPNIIINGTTIEFVCEYKYLGLIIDQKLSFKNHVNTLNRKLNRIVGASFSLKNLLTLETAKIFYHSMAASLLSYVAVAWGGCAATVLNNLQVAQNKIVRNLFSNLIPNVHTFDIYTSLSLPRVEDIYKIELGKLMFNVLNNPSYINMKTALSNLQWTHNFNTRKINSYRLPYARVNVNQSNTLFAAVSLWNSLPLTVRSSKSINSFKLNYKRYLGGE